MCLPGNHAEEYPASEGESSPTEGTERHMTTVTIIGGSGYAGAHIVEAAAVRGLKVRSMTRNEVAEQIGNVAYLSGSITDPADRTRALAGSDTLIVAVSPRGEMAGRVRDAVAALAAEADAAGVRLGVIGGAGSLRVSPDGPRLVDTPEFTEAFRAEAREMAAVLDDLRATPDSLDWFLVSPAAVFGSFAPGEYTGEYRIGRDVLLVDESGESRISGADFGVAVVDEVETPQHRRMRFTVAY